MFDNNYISKFSGALDRVRVRENLVEASKFLKIDPSIITGVVDEIFQESTTGIMPFELVLL